MDKSTENTLQFYLRSAISAAVVVMLFLAIRESANAGFGRLLAIYADRSNQMAAAQAALRLRPDDPETHYVRGATLEANRDYSAAVDEYATACRLRPDDYVLWSALAHARELSGDRDGAVAAAKQAVDLAPYYAQPRWQLGNILVRARHTEEGFKELRRSGEHDSTFLPAIIDLAWQLSNGDVEFIKRVVQPASPDFYTALAEYFKRRNRVPEALEMFRAAGAAAEPERSVFMVELIAAKRFNDAAILWVMDHPGDSPGMTAKLHNPGFEEEGNLDKAGFDWFQEKKSKSLSISLDLTQPSAGRASLRVDFQGDSDQVLPVISQLVLVEPRTRYQLRFAARTQELVSGGLPYVLITDAGNNAVLAQSTLFPRQTDWQEYKLDFNTGEGSGTLQLMVRRMPCSTQPCPIFGHLWLDDFRLSKLDPAGD